MTGKPKNFHIGIKAVIQQEGRVLVLKDPRFNGVDLPGGKIDEGEGIEQALKRELWEELGLKNFKQKELLHIFERKDYKGENTSLMLAYYLVEAKIDKIKLSSEHNGYEWVSAKDLKTLTKNGAFRNEGIKSVLTKVLK